MPTTYIPHLIPAEHYVDIVDLIRERLDALGFEPSTGAVEIRLTTGAPETDRAVHGTQAALDEHTPWSVENLAALIENPTATSQRWRKAIDVCASHVGEFLPTETIAAESGMLVNVWRSACRKMTVHQRATYPDETSWPLATASGRDIGEPVGPLYVAITPEQANRWAEANARIDQR